MSIVFFGTPAFAVPSLEALIEAKEELALVVCQPDKPQGRGRRIIHSPVKETALRVGIPIIQPDTLKDRSVHQRISELRPEFIVVVAYGKILPKVLLDMPERLPINVHASLLPRYRGAAPIQWALINGDEVTGVTTMKMDEGLDTGDILLQRKVDIDPSDNALTLSERLSVIGSRLLIETLQAIRQGRLSPKPQGNGATYAPPITKEQGRVDWSRPAKEIVNLVRGLYLWPKAYFYLHGELIKLYSAHALDGSGIPGRIEAISNGRLIVGTGDGLLAIEELQPEGKRKMTCQEFLAGRRLKVKYDCLT